MEKLFDSLPLTYLVIYINESHRSSGAHDIYILRKSIKCNCEILRENAKYTGLIPLELQQMQEIYLCKKKGVYCQRVVTSRE